MKCLVFTLALVSISSNVMADPAYQDDGWRIPDLQGEQLDRAITTFCKMTKGTDSEKLTNESTEIIEKFLSTVFKNSSDPIIKKVDGKPEAGKADMVAPAYVHSMGLSYANDQFRGEKSTFQDACVNYLRETYVDYLF